MKKDLILEVSVDSVESAIAAERGGAHRVELCANLLEGGVTPSLGMIVAVRKAICIDLHVMIRPRAGDFRYSNAECEIMRHDISAAKKLGADSVVLGLLKANGKVDVKRTRQLVALASPLRVTFHRAVDMSCDLLGSLRDLQKTGVHCILTSGGQQTAAKGAAMLRRLVRAAGGALDIMAGSGIEQSNVAALIERTGVGAIHASLRFPVPSNMRYRNAKVSMGTAKNREYQRQVVREDKVRELLQAASGH